MRRPFERKRVSSKYCRKYHRSLRSSVLLNSSSVRLRMFQTPKRMMSLRVLRSCRITSSRILSGSCASDCASGSACRGDSSVIAGAGYTIPPSLPLDIGGVAGVVADPRGVCVARGEVEAVEEPHHRAATGNPRHDRHLRNAVDRTQDLALHFDACGVIDDGLRGCAPQRVVEDADVRSIRRCGFDEDELSLDPGRKPGEGHELIRTATAADPRAGQLV